VKKFAIVAAAACVLIAGTAAADAHWLRRGWGGYGGPPYGIEYSRAYGYAFNSGYYLSGYAGCMGVQHMCASRWGWSGPGYRSCIRHQPC
jgi:opacity protein-like surface antigen